MADDTSLADLLGTPHELPYNGTLYKIKEIDLAGKAEYQRWLEREAIASALVLTETMPPAAAERYLAQVSRDIGAKKYAWGGELCDQSRREPAGVVKMLQIVLSRNHPEVDEALATEILSDATARRTLALMEAAKSEDPKVREQVRILFAALGLNLKCLDELSSPSPSHPSSSHPNGSDDSPTTN